MRAPIILISDAVIEKLSVKHKIEPEDVYQGIRNATQWRKSKGRFVAESRVDSGRRIFVVVDRVETTWVVVTAWWT